MVDPDMFPYVEVVVDIPAVGDRRFTYELPCACHLPYGAKVQVPFGRTQAEGYVVGRGRDKPDFDVKSVSAVYDLRFLPPGELLDLGKALKQYYVSSVASFWRYLWPPLVRRKRLEPGMVLGRPISAGQGTVGAWKAPELTELDSFARSVFVQGPAASRWEYYFERMEHALSSGLGVIVLVPDIRKLGSAVRHLESRFGPVAVIHSDLRGSTRRENWLRLLEGRSGIAVGSRSAVFSPVRNLGLIVVDEEESHLYKAEESPRFNAATVARIRANLQGCQVLLGSFVPSVRIHYYMSKGELKNTGHHGTPAAISRCEAKSPCRAEPTWEDTSPWADRPTSEGLSACPDASVTYQVVSMLGTKRGLTISKHLHLALRDIFHDGERAVLFLNRRGTSSALVCCDCGSTVMCPRCSVSLAYHARETLMVCHTCGYREPPPLECPVCRGFTWRQVGYGIDRMESEFKKRFPGVPIFLLDQDTKAPEDAVARFGSSEPSCLLCTQMVLGFELPPFTGLGVVSCDSLLSFPDYSAPEQVFKLLMDLVHLLKCSGGNPQKQFLVQTLNPQHHAVRGVQDPEAFYTVEAENRAVLSYPPFGSLFKLEFSGKHQDKVKQLAEEFAREVEARSGDIRVLGPGPAPKARVRGRYRWIVVLKSRSKQELSQVVSQVMDGVSQSQVRITVDTEEPFGIG
ncbi:MAG: primosomal protein N' [Firmicutes bacterium]|nr:primosomal protein N' [Candidatus Fermentithermobacillaceae bacterium]